MSTSTEAMKKIMEGMAQVCEGVAEQLAILQEEIEEVLEDSIPDGEPEPLKKDLMPISTGRKGAAKSSQRKTPARKKKADAPVKEDASAKGDKPEITMPESEKAVPEETAAVDTAGTESARSETTETNEPLQEEAAESTEEEAAEDSRPSADTGPGDKPSGNTPSAAETSAVTLTMDDLTSVIVAKIKQHRPNSEKIQKIVQSYGVEKLPDLPASKYESFLADVSKL